MRSSISGDWASGNPAFAISRGSPNAPSLTPEPGRWFPGMLLSPYLSAPGKPSDQEPPSEFLPAEPGIRQSASRRNFAISRGSPGAPLPDAWTRPPVSWHAIFPFHLSDPGSAIRSRDISSRPCPLRGRYNAAPRGAATTVTGRTARSARPLPYDRSPSGRRARRSRSGGATASAGCSTSISRSHDL